MRSSRRSAPSTPSGISATSSATARSRTPWSSGWPRSARSACAATTTRPRSAAMEIEWFNPDARAADGVDARHGSAASTRRVADGDCRIALAEGDFTLVHGSPRDPMWEYVTVGVDRPRATSPSSTTPHGLHGHTHLPIVFAETRRPRRADRRPATARRPGARRPPDAAQPGQRRPAARRRPARPSYLVLDLEAGGVHLASGRLRHRGGPGGDARGRPAARGWSTGSSVRRCDPDRETDAPRMIGGRRPLQGRKPADRRVRVERPHAPYFRYTGPGQLVGQAGGQRRRRPQRARSSPGSGPSLLGRPLATEEEIDERLSKTKALAIFSSDAISSSAYATEEILRVLVLAGRGAALLLSARGRDRDRGPAGRRLALVPPGLPRLPERAAARTSSSKDEPRRRSRPRSPRRPCSSTTS